MEESTPRAGERTRSTECKEMRKFQWSEAMSHNVHVLTRSEGALAGRVEDVASDRAS